MTTANDGGRLRKRSGNETGLQTALKAIELSLLCTYIPTGRPILSSSLKRLTNGRAGPAVTSKKRRIGNSLTA